MLLACPWDSQDIGAGVHRVQVTATAATPRAVTATVFTTRGLIVARVAGDTHGRARGPSRGGTKIVVTLHGVWDEATMAAGGFECGFGTIAPVPGLMVTEAQGVRGAGQGGRMVECVSPAGVEGAVAALRVRAVGGAWSDLHFAGGSVFTYDRAAPAGGSASGDATSSSWSPLPPTPVLRRASPSPSSGGTVVWLSGSAFGDGSRGSGNLKPCPSNPNPQTLIPKP